MTRIFGFADILAGLLFVASFYKVDIPRGMAMTFGIYLMLKGLIFIMNYFSWIDIAAGVFLVFGLSANLHPYALLALAIFLGLKGIASLLSFT